MQSVMDPGEVVTVATSGRWAAMPLRLTTSLYGLMAALQAVVAPNDDARVVATMAHLLRSRRLTWLGTDYTRRGPSRRPMGPPRPRGSPPSRRGQGRGHHASRSLQPRDGALRTRPTGGGGRGLAALHGRCVEATRP
jgi:hypothetical protein